MKLKHVFFVSSLMAGLWCTTLVGAQPKELDAKGGKDHPLITRYAGSWLIAYGIKPFEEVDIPLSYEAEKGSYKLVKTQHLEGEITRIAYLAPLGRSVLEVQRNYEAALEGAGAQKILGCTKEACAEGIKGIRAGFQQYLYDLPKNQQAWESTANVFNGYESNMHSQWKWARPTGDLYISVMTVTPYDPKERAGTMIQVVKPKAMETDKVSITNADAMGKGLAAEGKIALYGVYFDTGKADIKPESKPQMEEMAKLLGANKAIKVFIVGHTDNQGSLETNVALSQKRGQAIADALVKDYKIEAKRMQARGVANFSPIASNAQDAGRAKNRRVELVEQ
jgi:OmpA-OmpF porin, OOP family